jgi:hypothetical protein
MVTPSCRDDGRGNVSALPFQTGFRLGAINRALDQAGMAATKQVEVATPEAIDREIARLEAGLGTVDDAT